MTPDLAGREDLVDLPRVLGVLPRADVDLPADGGTLLLVVGGIHGNEPAGVRAIRTVLAELEVRQPRLQGRVVGLVGNAGALPTGRRFQRQDLNRLWTDERLGTLREPSDPATLGEGPEELEQRALVEAVRPHLLRRWRRIVLLDLHSTSAGGAPFTIISDTLQNRPVAFALPVPILLGLEERIQGTLLSWFADQGHVSICLEGGQNDLPSTVAHHESALWLTLVSTGLLREQDVPGLDEHRARLAGSAASLPRVVELRYRCGIPEDANFEMLPGFQNFQPVRKGEVLARLATGTGVEEEVEAPLAGRVLLPRYQPLGDDGFFLGREVRPFWLWLSALLRRARLSWSVHLLPGVRRDPTRPNELLVDRRIARFWAVEILHLFGFRWRAREGRIVRFVRRRDVL
jgi:predicted deacylase